MAFVVREKSFFQSSLTHLMSAPSIFQGSPIATRADEISQLMMGNVFSK